MSKWNDANSYRGEKFAWDKTVSKSNRANGYEVQPYSKQSLCEQVVLMMLINDCRERSSAMSSNWNNANDYEEQSNNNSISGRGQTRSH